jgi:hypothetical protein
VIGGKNEAMLRDDIEDEFRPHLSLSQLDCPHILAVYGKSHRKRKIPPHYVRALSLDHVSRTA